MKKTTKKKTAKRAPTKQAKAFEAALEAFKKPEHQVLILPAPELRKHFESIEDAGAAIKTIATSNRPSQEPSFMEEGDVQFDADGNVMGPIGEMRAVKLGGETISLEEADAQEGISPKDFNDIQPDAPSLPAGEPAKASQPASGHIVPQAPPDAPQTPPSVIIDAMVRQAQEMFGHKLGEGADIVTPDIDHRHASSVIEDLIEGLNYTFNIAKHPAKRLKEHDTPILQGRVKLARELISQLRLAD